MTVDIFIPVADFHSNHFPTALYSALTQTYSPIRVVLFIDGINPITEFNLKKWWYTPSDIPTGDNLDKTNGYSKDKLHIEMCDRGVLVRNPGGSNCSSHNARQWYFEWGGKSSVMKTLDADDILHPRAIDIMMRYMKSDVDGVFCPLLKTSSGRFGEIMKSDINSGTAGSGSMMLKKEFMDRIIQEGFQWPAKRGNDRYFFDFVHDKGFNFVVVNETALYFYLK